MRWKKNLTVLLSLWSDDMDTKTMGVFQNSHLGGTDEKSCSFWLGNQLSFTIARN